VNIEIREDPRRYAPRTLYVVLVNGLEVLRQISVPSELDIAYAQRASAHAPAADKRRPCIHCGQSKAADKFGETRAGVRNPVCLACVQKINPGRAPGLQPRFQRAPKPTPVEPVLDIDEEDADA